MKTIIVTLILSTLIGLLSNIIATWIEPKLSKYRTWTILAFIFLSMLGVILFNKEDTLEIKQGSQTKNIQIDTTLKKDLPKQYFDESLAMICRSGSPSCKEIWYSANCGESHLLLDNKGRCIYYVECAHVDASIYIGQYYVEETGKITCTFQYKCFGMAYIDPNKQGTGEPEVRQFSYSKIKEQNVNVVRNECEDLEYKNTYQFYVDIGTLYDGPTFTDFTGQVGQVTKYKEEINFLKNLGYYNRIQKLFTELKW